MILTVGETYKLSHSRFGRATVRITNNGELSEWVEVEVVSGLLRGMCDEWGPGETKTLRKTQCNFTPAKGVTK